MTETKGDLFRKNLKGIKGKGNKTKKPELPKGKMLEADGESVRKEFENRYNKKIEKEQTAKEMEPAKLKGGRVELRGGGICKKGMNKKAIGANS